MDRVTVTELRQNLASWLDRVQQGDEVMITERGQVIARLLPAPSRQAAARERLVALRGNLLRGDVDVPLAADDWEAAS